MTRAISVLLEGDFVDAYLYGGQIIAWDARGRLVIGSTGALAAAVADATSMSRKVTQAAFFNDKALGDGATRLEVLDGWNNSKPPEGLVHLRLDAINPEFHALAPDEHVLDLMVTYNRLYVSTDDALLSTPLSEPGGEYLQRRLSLRCFNTTPRWGAVSASCASAGSWALLNETGLSREGSARTEQIDEHTSIRLSWLGTSLLSFDDEGSIDIYKASVPRQKGERQIAKGFLSADRYGGDADLDWWLSDPDDPLGIRDSDYVVAFTGMLVVATDGVLMATQIATWSGFPQPLGEPHMLGRVPGRILSIVDASGGFVVETDDALHYLDDSQPTLLASRETIALRSYQRSKRHRRTITATVEGGLLISVLLGDPYQIPTSDRTLYPSY